VCTDGVARSVKGPHFSPPHVTRFFFGPSHRNEEPRLKASRVQDRQGEVEIRDVSIVESEFRRHSLPMIILSVLRYEISMALKNSGFNGIRILTLKWPQFVIEKIKARRHPALIGNGN
jgi:hypothetical protein